MATINGSSSNDTINGSSGADSITASSGNDSVNAAGGNDTVYGGIGTDDLYGGTGNDALYGDSGNDTISGNSGADFIDGGTENDALQGGQGKDTILGGDGADNIIGDGQWYDAADYASVTSGTSTILTITNSADAPVELWWIDGSGTLSYYSTIQPGQTLVQPTFTDHNWMLRDQAGYYLEVIEGAANQTVNYGAEGLNDSIDGGTGNDYVVAQYGNDTILGGSGADTVYGGSGADLIYGGNDNDSLFAETGNDTVFGGLGDDYVNLGDGNDSFGNFNDEGGKDTIYGGAGNDYIISGGEDDNIYGGTGNDSMSGGVGSDSLYGGSGNDEFYVTDDHNYDYIAGGTDFDAIYYSNFISTSGVTVTFSGSDTGSYSFGGTSTTGNFIEIEQIGGTEYADTNNAAADTNGVNVYGNGGNDSIIGGSGNDLLDGGLGNDTLIGGSGADSLSGGNDADIIYGGAGDTIVGGEGGTDNDTLFLNYANVQQITYGGGNNEAGTVIFTATSGGGTLTFSEIENIRYIGAVDGASGADTIGAGYVDAEGDAVDGADGDPDLIFAGAGNDTVTAGAGNDTVFGDLGNDQLSGGAGDDTLYGGAGTDTLSGDAGNDQLFGGADADRFTIVQGSGVDTIAGGETGSDYDELYLTGSGANITFTGNEAGNYTFVGGGSGSFTEIERVNGTTGNDTIDASATTDGTNLLGDAGNDSLIGGSGADLFNGDLGNDTIYGGAGNDTLGGEAGDDLLYGGDGDDWLLALSGNDTSYGGAGNDYFSTMSGNALFYGGEGNDTVLGGSGSDTIFGDAGNDTLSGGGGNDSIDGGDGADTLAGGTGNDTLIGGAGADSLSGGDGADVFYGGAGDTVIGGEGGTDTDILILNRADVESITYGGGNNESGTVSFTSASGGGTLTFAEIEQIRYSGSVEGTEGGDNIGAGYIDAEGDAIDGADSLNDTVFGGGGNDNITAGAGDDLVFGGTGGDWIYDGAGNDTAYGDSGSDSYYAGAGNDVFYGGSGFDIVTLKDGYGNDTFYGGNDTGNLLSAYDTTSPQTIVFTSATGGTVTGAAGTANFTDFYSFDGAWGVGGTFDASLSGSAVYFNDYGGPTNATGSNFDDMITAYGADDADRSYYGGDGSDYLDTGDGDDTIDGGTGDDYVVARGGDDLVTGGDGNDTLYGGDGNDSLSGGAGDDILLGNTGSDTAVFTGDVTEYGFDYAADGALIVTDLVGGRDGVDTISGFDYVEFNGVTYHLVRGDDGSNTTLQGPGDGTPSLIIAHDGNDWGGGHTTSDVIFGGAGDDTLDGGDGDDTLLGEDGNDLLRGDAGNDQAFGGAGDDTLAGGLGDDTLTGGSGHDTFGLTQSSGADRVTDFDMTLDNGRTADQLDVSELRTQGGDRLTWRDVVVTDTVGDGSGDAVLTFPGGESVVMEGVSPEEVDSKQEMAAIGIPCFVSGTQIQTPAGWAPVESLRIGDRVLTTEGVRHILWAGHRFLSWADLARNPHLKPVHFPAGAIGNNKPLRLSPQHAVALRDADGNCLLVRAKHLAASGFGKARIAQGVRQVTYHHILLAEHSVMCANGAATESFYPGPHAIAMLDWPARLAVSAAILADPREGRTAKERTLSTIYGESIHPYARRKALDQISVVWFDALQAMGRISARPHELANGESAFAS